jgi:hypothetical protein
VPAATCASWRAAVFEDEDFAVSSASISKRGATNVARKGPGDEMRRYYHLKEDTQQPGASAACTGAAQKPRSDDDGAENEDRIAHNRVQGTKCSEPAKRKKCHTRDGAGPAGSRTQEGDDDDDDVVGCDVAADAVALHGTASVDNDEGAAEDEHVDEGPDEGDDDTSEGDLGDVMGRGAEPDGQRGEGMGEDEAQRRYQAMRCDPPPCASTRFSFCGNAKQAQPNAAPPVDMMPVTSSRGHCAEA